MSTTRWMLKAKMTMRMMKVEMEIRMTAQNRTSRTIKTSGSDAGTRSPYVSVNRGSMGG